MIRGVADDTGPVTPGPGSSGAVDALAEPTRTVSRGYIAGLTLANLGILVAFYTPIQNLLPRYADQVAGADGKEVALAWITGVGAAVSVVANPLAGAFSDRTTSRFGRRRPWLLGGALAGALSLVVLAQQSTVLTLAFAWGLVQASVNAAFAGTTATIPDQVPVRQRGVVSGFVGLAQTLGVVVGVALVSFVVTDLQAGVYLVAVLLVVLVLPFAVRLRDPVLPAEAKPPFRLGEFLKEFWVSPREHPDFAWAWITRFLLTLGNSMAILYLLFYLQDEVEADNPEQAQTILIVIYAVGTILTAIVGGWLSDRSGKRKVYVIGASLVMAVAGLILAFLPTFAFSMLAALVLGLGYGVYLAVDQALITQVLPNAEDRGRDLGVINVANALPQVLAPVIAAPIVTSLGGYPALYTAMAVVTVVSGVLVRNIKSVP